MRELSVPAVTTVAKEANLTDPVWRNAETSPDMVQFARPDGDSWQEVTAAAFRDEVVTLARG